MKVYVILILCAFINFFSLEGASSTANAVVIDNNNKILLGGMISNGSGNDFLLVRYNPDGSFDTTFNAPGILTGRPGVVITDIRETNDQINSIVIDNSNRIVVAGFSSNGLTNDIAVARYNDDGSLDTTFNPAGVGSGVPGIVITDVSGFDDAAYAVVIDNSNRIVVAGSTNSGVATSVVTLRYNDDGSLDTTFNPAGISSGIPGIVITTVTDVDDEARGVVIDNNNKIVVGGFARSSSGSSFLAIRYNDDGTLDPTFATLGIFVFERSANDRANDIDIDNNNKIVLAGVSNEGTNNDFALVRINPDGTLDTTFNPLGRNSGIPGIVMQDVGDNNDTATGLIIDNNNNLVTTGIAQVNTSTVFATMRHTNSGDLDITFNPAGTLTGIPGIVITEIIGLDPLLPGERAIAESHAIALDNENKIVVAGFSQDILQRNIVTVRYNSDGSLDTTLNPDGRRPGILLSLLVGRGIGRLPIGYPQDDLLPEALASLSPTLLQEVSSGAPIFAIPTISGESPLITSLTDPVLTGTASPNALITVFSNDIQVTQVSADEQGLWRAVLPTLTDGTYNVYVVAEDPLTRFTLASDRTVLVVDTHMPTPPIIESPAPHSWIDTTAPVIQGTAKPSSFITLFLNNRRITTVVADTEGRWTFTSPVLPEGKYALYAVSTDRARNRSARSQVYTFTIDTAAFRAPRIVNPVDRLVTNRNRPTVTGEARADAVVTIVLNGRQMGTVKANARGGWTYTFTTPLADGDYRLSATMPSPAGPTLLTSAITTFTVDTVPPRPAIISQILEGGQALSGLAEPGSTVTLYLDGVLLDQVVTDPRGRWGYTPQDISAGTHRLSITVADRAGNVSSMVERTLDL